MESSVASELESLKARFATNVVLANRSPEDSKIQDSASLHLFETPSAVARAVHAVAEPVTVGIVEVALVRAAATVGLTRPIAPADRPIEFSRSV